MRSLQDAETWAKVTSAAKVLKSRLKLGSLPPCFASTLSADLAPRLLAQFPSGTILIAPQGHSAAQTPQPLQ